MTDFAAAKEQVARLVGRFHTNPPANETTVRVAFINPFFEALGWDVANRAGREIDALVYELYGLTEKEIRIVEGATR